MDQTFGSEVELMKVALVFNKLWEAVKLCSCTYYFYQTFGSEVELIKLALVFNKLWEAVKLCSCTVFISSVLSKIATAFSLLVLWAR